MHHLRRLIVALMIAAAFPAAAQAAELPTAPGTKSSWTARVITPANALQHPGHGRVIQLLGRNTPFWGGPNVLLVLGAKTVDGVDYVKVLVKRMPAGSAGWVPAEDVKLTRVRRQVTVDLSERTLTVRDSGRQILKDRVVVGAKLTPTPTGQFAVDAPVDQPKSSELGPRVLALAAYSRALARYQGGLPQVAFHAYEKLGAPLGTASSHGCIRMRQATLNRLLKLLDRGTPVLIRA